jgi:Fe-S cluster assembly protein SufB
MAYTETELAEELENSKYKYGFTSKFDTDRVEKGLNEDIIRQISSKKNEPEWLLEFRLEAYRNWKKMKEPKWAHVKYDEV